MRNRHRVVVTGFGALAANGIGNDAFWQSLVSGQSGIGYISLFDASDLPMRVAGEVKDFDLNHFVAAQTRTRRMARHTQFALAAALLATRDAKLDTAKLDRSVFGVFLGVSNSALDVIERGLERMVQRGGRQRFSPYTVAASQPHAPASLVASFLGAPAFCQTISSACASGLQAVAQGARLIRDGKLDVAICGGADAPLTPFVVGSFSAAGMLPTRNGDPTKVSRPFDRNRTGGVIAEGAGVVVLESAAHASARGASPCLEILGCGTSMDLPGSRPGSALSDAMYQVMSNAARRPEDVHYICAHGSSDPLMDIVETEAIKSVFGKHAFSVPTSSIKGVLGNPLAAAGPLQIATCALACRHQIAPPTANYQEPDPECDLDYVPQLGRRMPIETILINAHGLGGGNACMLVTAGGRA